VKSRILQDFESPVEDWKGHSICNYGLLLLYGTFDALRARGEPTKQYRVYLFEGVLFLAKERPALNPKTK
jgi:cell division control protein 24